MRTLLIILIFVLYHGINILIAWINDRIVTMRIANKNPNQINHFLWGAIYLATVIPIYFLFPKPAWLMGAIILLHLSIFPVSYNLFRGNAPFALSKTSNAVTDKFMVDVGLKDTEIVNIGAEIIAIVLVIFSIYK
jgi:hypothetical protein